MDNAYQPDLWRDLYAMLGTSSAALIGLLFVVTTIQLGNIINDPAFRVRARNSIIVLLTTLILAALVLTPQPSFALGSELVAISLFGLQLPIVVIHRYRTTPQYTYTSTPIYRAVLVLVSYLLGIAGGIGLIEQSSWSMYLVTAAYLGLLIAVVLNSWALMLGVGLMEKATKTK